MAELYRGGLLTEVRAPTPEEESVRDLCRCRDDIRGELMSARHRLGKFLLRRDVRYGQGEAWTQKHRRWLKTLQFEHRAAEVTFGSYLHAIKVLEERTRAVEQVIGEIAEEEPYREPVAWLRSFRGIDTVTAMTIVAERHDFRRFATPRAPMAHRGLVASENSTGDNKKRGSITKTGNKHVRRIIRGNITEGSPISISVADGELKISPTPPPVPAAGPAAPRRRRPAAQRPSRPTARSQAAGPLMVAHGCL